ncbi:MAG: helical backbone metal receptor [Bacteroidota bacterium]
MKITDQLGNSFSLSAPPKKIISIVPSQTELLFDLGLNTEIVGVTKYCIHPTVQISNLHCSIVGGTKKINIEKIKKINPDIIIGNKEENEKEQILKLMKTYPVWMSDIKTLEDALEMIVSIGKITGKKNKALKIQNDIRERFSHFRFVTFPATNNSVAYLIWKNPYICAGKNTFIDHLLHICGLQNVFTSKIYRYPKITAAEIFRANPSFIFLSSEPYPFCEKHIREFQHICPNSKIILVDGKMFSWFGSHLLYAPSYFEQLLIRIQEA